MTHRWPRPPGCTCDSLPSGIVACAVCRANPGWKEPEKEAAPVFKMDVSAWPEDDRYELRRQLLWLVKRAEGTSAPPSMRVVAGELAQLADSVMGGQVRCDPSGLNRAERETVGEVLRNSVNRVGGSTPAGRALRTLERAWDAWLWPNGRPAPKPVKAVERPGMWDEGPDIVRLRG